MTGCRKHEAEFLVKNELGLHARPAAQLVHLASSFQCDVQLRVSGDLVDAKSILGLLQLGAAVNKERGRQTTWTC